MSFNRPRSPLAALWDLGLAWHAAAGFVVLLALSAYVKPAYGCVTDEGHYALQAISLSERDAWTLPDRTLWIDPEGRANLDAGYTKHPFYPWLLSKAYGLFGTFGLVLPSILGTVLAGISAWLLLDARSGSWRRAGFWLTVLGSPLYVYSALVFGHALAAGAAGIMLFALMKWTSGSNAGWLAIALGCASAVLMLRSEGILLLGAVGAALGIEAVRRPEERRRDLVALLSCGAVFLAVTLFERTWRSSIGGTAPAWVDPSAGRVANPLAGTFRALLGPGGSLKHWANVLLLLSALTIPILGRQCRKGNWTAAAAFALVPTAGYLLWACSRQDTWVSGLILTCPLLWFGLWCRSRERWPFLAGAGALFLLAVCATQGTQGGGLEWGGRYLAIGLPILVVLSVSGLASLLSSAPPRARGAIVAAGVAVSFLVLATATDVLRRSHLKTRAVSEQLTHLAALAGAAGDHPVNGNQPILLTNHYLLPTIDWPDYDKFNWVMIHGRDPRYFLERLRQHSIRGFILIQLARTKEPFLPELASFGYEVRESKAYPTFDVHLILARAP